MKKTLLGLPLVLLVVLSAIVVFTGSQDLAFGNVWDALTGHGQETTAYFIVHHLRLPSLWTALLAGFSLAAAGLVMQTLMGNPLADPSLLGVNAGAGFGAALAVLLLGGSVTIGSFSVAGHMLTVVAAAIGAIAVTALLVALSLRFRDNLRLLIAGVMVSFSVSSIVSILGYFATAEGLQNYVFWGMGSFVGTSGRSLLFFALIVLPCLLVIMLCAHPLNGFLLGEDYARNLGIPVRRMRTLLLLVSGLLCGVTTAFCGPIGFIGLASPHVARLFHRSADHRRLIPLTILWGGNLTLLSSVIARLPAGTALPVGTVTPLLGVPVVFWLMSRRHRS